MRVGDALAGSLQKQAKGKKRMKMMGQVNVPQEAFMAERDRGPNPRDPPLSRALPPAATQLQQERRASAHARSASKNETRD